VTALGHHEMVAFQHRVDVDPGPVQLGLPRRERDGTLLFCNRGRDGSMKRDRSCASIALRVVPGVGRGLGSTRSHASERRAIRAATRYGARECILNRRCTPLAAAFRGAEGRWWSEAIVEWRSVSPTRPAWTVERARTVRSKVGKAVRPRPSGTSTRRIRDGGRIGMVATIA
jgi:hypothetical protein